ncbi:MAG TPA: hypothetical protein VIN03_01970 [Roseateles sp.]
MPIEFSFSWLLYDPAYAAVLGLTLIFVVAFATYVATSRKPTDQIDRRKRKLALIAEMLVSVGVVGLITVAARTKIDAEIHGADSRSQELQREVNAEVWDFVRIHCLRPTTVIPPTRALGTIYEACDWWPKLITSPDRFVNWWGARERFQAMAIEQQVPGELKARYASIARKIDQLIEAQNNHALDKHKKKLLEQQLSWPFIAICAAFALIGIALKWARAALDLRGSQARPGSSSQSSK